jgi:hypothetical protein
VEILVVLEAIDPPVGYLHMTSSTEQPCNARQAGDDRPDGPEVSFAGWLELLRALYVVTDSG